MSVELQLRFLSNFLRSEKRLSRKPFLAKFSVEFPNRTRGSSLFDKSTVTVLQCGRDQEVFANQKVNFSSLLFLPLALANSV